MVTVDCHEAVRAGATGRRVYLLAHGLSTAGAGLASEAIGAGESEAARRAGLCARALTLAALAACGRGCTFFASSVARTFASRDHRTGPRHLFGTDLKRKSAASRESTEFRCTRATPRVDALCCLSRVRVTVFTAQRGRLGGSARI